MTDIAFPAHLQLRFDNTNDGFPAAERAARESAENIRRAFTTNMADVRKTISEALSIPRGAGGGLDLGIPQLREAVAATEARAIAAREVAQALRTVAAEEKNYSQSMRQTIIAAGAAAKAEEAELTQLRAKVVVEEQLQAVLARTASATDRVQQTQRSGTTTFGAATNSTRALGFATIQANQQLQDIVISLQGGQRASTVFAQQLPQLAFVLSGVTGEAGSLAAKVGGLARFFAGGWGTAIILATSILTPFIAKMFESGDASKEAAKAVEKHKNAIEQLIEAQGRALQSSRDLYIQDQASLETERQKAAATVKATIALLEQAKTVARLSQLNAGEGGSAGDVLQQQADANAAKGRVLEIDTQLSKARSDLQQLETARRQGDIKYLSDAVTDRSTPDGKVRARYGRLISDAQKEGVRTGDTNRAAQEIARLNAARDAELERIRDTEKALKRSRTSGGGGDNVTASQLAKTIRDAIPGAVVTSGLRSRAEQEVLYKRYLNGTGNIAAKPGTSDHEFNRAIDIRKTAGVTLDSVRNALTQRGIEIKQIIDEGNVIHVAAGKGKIALQGFNEASRDAERAQKELLRTLEQTVGQFDGARDAADEYAKALENIATLSAANKISSGQALDYTIAAGRRLSDVSTRASNDNAAKFYGDQGIDPAADFKKIVDNAAETYSTTVFRAAKGTQEFADQLARSTSDIANTFTALFGGKVGNTVGALAAFASGQSFLPQGVNRDDLGKSINFLFKKKDSDKFGKDLAGGFENALKGSAIGSIIGNALGGADGARTGAAIGGVLGGASSLADALSKAGNSGIGKAASAASPYVAAVVAGFEIGTAIGGLLKPKARASATITSASQKIYSVGNNDTSVQNVKGTVDTVQATLSKIIEALGGVEGAFNVSIGQYKDYFRVSSTGANAGNKNLPSGTIYDGKDANEAIRIAIRDAINDGAVQGIRDGAQRLLSTGLDLERQVNKALKFQSVFDQLDQIKNPVAFAVKGIDKEFKNLKAIFEEAGASAADYASLEELYSIKRKDAVKQATEAEASAYKALLDQLTTGDNGRSLRDRSAAARAVYDPLAADLAAGKTVDASAYTDAARTLLDIQRQLYGSSSEFFGLQDEVTKTLRDQISSIDAKSKAAEASAPVVSAIETQTTTLVNALSAVNDNIGRLLFSPGGGSGGGGFAYGNIANF
jgi:hypothetical protein